MKKAVKGSFVEKSQAASSYRGEMLKMLAIHLFLLAVEESYGTVAGRPEVHCDNKGALYTFSKKGKRIPSGSKMRTSSKYSGGSEKGCQASTRDITSKPIKPTTIEGHICPSPLSSTASATNLQKTQSSNQRLQSTAQVQRKLKQRRHFRWS